MRRFFDTQPAKEPQFHDACLIGIACGEPLERLVHSQYFNRDRVRRGVNSLGLQCNLRYRTTPLQGLTASGVVDQDSSHELGGNGKKLSPAVPRCVSLIDEL